jgi:hypothetical protein
VGREVSLSLGQARSLYWTAFGQSFAKRGAAALWRYERERHGGFAGRVSIYLGMS